MCYNLSMRYIRICTKIGLFLIISLVEAVVISNATVILSSKAYIFNEADFVRKNSITDTPKYEAIIVLGAGIVNDRPTPLLAERLNTGIELFKLGFADKIVMSGDSQDAWYDEVGAMTEYAVARGVPRTAILRDNLGLNTHSTIYRAKTAFELQKYILVSQNYHLERAVYLAKAFGADAVGVSCDKTRYSGQFYRDMREIAARVKDFFVGLLKMPPVQPDEAVPER